jgi:signal transduction histidine kinase
MLYISLLGLVLGVALYFAFCALGFKLIDTVYMSDQRVSQRKSEIYTRFSSYVTANSISGKDTAAVTHWTAENDYVTILLYESSNHYQRFAGGHKSALENMADYDSSQVGKLYPVRFSDGVHLIAILDSSQELQKAFVKIASIAISCAGFVILLLVYMNKMTKRIIALSKSAAIVSAGQLDMSISAAGNDEIASLAQNIDEMRQSVITQMSRESKAWQANTELITAISHDIRTPMTSMIGYLGILNDSDFSDTEHCRQYARSAYAKAMDLKALTDELFKYFLVFGSAELSMNTESLDGRLLLEQLSAEAEFTLTEAGFTVQTIPFDGECTIVADPMYLKRVVDNLVSNVLKYGDREKRVMLIMELNSKRLSLCVSNNITKSLDKVESTKIGLRTCQRIMEHMDGSFTTVADDDHFAAEFSLPVQS